MIRATAAATNPQEPTVGAWSVEWTDGNTQTENGQAGNSASAGPGLALFDAASSADGYASDPVIKAAPNEHVDLAAAVANDAYIEFPLQGGSLDPAELRFDIARGGSSGPRGWELRSSADGYASTIDSGVIGTVRPNLDRLMVDLSTVPATTNLALRLYLATPSSAHTVEVDSVRVASNISAPVITTQPASGTVAAGSSGQPSVAALGLGVVFQWYEGPSGDTSSPLAGQTSNAMTRVWDVADDGMQVWCRAANITGTADSDAATVTVVTAVELWESARDYSDLLSPTGGAAGGTTRYVSKAGNDANAGTVGSPYLTVAYAISQMAAGDELVINDEGVYVENQQLTLPGGVNNSRWTTLRRGGNKKARGSNPRIETNAHSAVGIAFYGNYMQAYGIELVHTNPSPSMVGWESGFFAGGGAYHHFKFLNCYAENFNTGFHMAFQNSGNYPGTDMTLVAGCWGHDNGDYHTNGGSGISVNGNTDNWADPAVEPIFATANGISYRHVIIGNLTSSNEERRHGFGGDPYTGTGNFSDGNGIITGDNGRTRYDLLPQPAAGDPTRGPFLVINNIVIDSGGGGIKIFDTPVPHVYHNTCVYNGRHHYTTGPGGIHGSYATSDMPGIGFHTAWRSRTDTGANGYPHCHGNFVWEDPAVGAGTGSSTFGPGAIRDQYCGADWPLGAGYNPAYPRIPDAHMTHNAGVNIDTHSVSGGEYDKAVWFVQTATAAEGSPAFGLNPTIDGTKHNVDRGGGYVLDPTELAYQPPSSSALKDAATYTKVCPVGYDFSGTVRTTASGAARTIGALEAA